MVNEYTDADKTADNEWTQPNNAEATVEAGLGACQLGIANDTGRLVYKDKDGTAKKAQKAVMTALGDTVYGAASGMETALAGNTAVTKKILGQTGDGVNSAAPAWSEVTGTGDVVLATTPTLVTPVIGVATGTSVVLSGDVSFGGALTGHMTAVKTAAYTILATDFTVRTDDTSLGADAALTLPAASGCAGRIYCIHARTANATYNFVLTPDGSDTIEESASMSLVFGEEYGGSVIIQSDGVSAWIVLSKSVIAFDT